MIYRRKGPPIAGHAGGAPETPFSPSGTANKHDFRWEAGSPANKANAARLNGAAAGCLNAKVKGMRYLRNSWKLLQHRNVYPRRIMRRIDKSIRLRAKIQRDQSLRDSGRFETVLVVLVPCLRFSSVLSSMCKLDRIRFAANAIQRS